MWLSNLALSYEPESLGWEKEKKKKKKQPQQLNIVRFKFPSWAEAIRSVIIPVQNMWDPERSEED
ncbi:hypothetical protein INR49_014025 [Caranx melampygus]|nr:hypothetical protein INR49_014025 [Caranx melampygus]